MNLNVDNYCKIVELKYCTSSLFVSPPKDVKKQKLNMDHNTSMETAMATSDQQASQTAPPFLSSVLVGVVSGAMENVRTVEEHALESVVWEP